jgi:hypothetical protein
LSNFVKEATYVFQYNGEEFVVNAFVDPIENRRYVGGQEISAEVPGTPLNYIGTGEEHNVFYPAIVNETEPFDYNPWQRQNVIVTYKLPDVDAYAIGRFGVLEEAGSQMNEFRVQLIDKI